METSQSYLAHKDIVKNLNFYEDNSKRQIQHQSKFELIYEDAKKYDIKLSNAKSFLTNLSNDEINTLKNFSGLTKAIKIDKLSNEGAYNLLMHSYEKYDFNNNGFTETAETYAVMPVPRNMESDAKKAWINAINNLEQKDTVALYTLTLAVDKERLKHSLAQNLNEMSETEKSYIQKNTSYDINKFQEDTLSKIYIPKQITIEDIGTEVKNILSKNYVDSKSSKVLDATSNFWNNFKVEYEKVKIEKGERVSTEELFNSKTQLSDMENINEIGALEEALQVIISKISQKSSQRNSFTNEIRTPEEIIKVYRSQPGMDGIYVEGIFEKMQSDAALLLKEHEPSFKLNYPLYEKYKDVFTPVYSNYTREKANNLGRDLYAQFPNIHEMKDKAYYGGTQEDMDAFWEMHRDYQAYNKYLRKKYDIDMSFKLPYTQEASKAYNFAVYEQLENGVNLVEATQMASIVAEKFGNGEGRRFYNHLLTGIPENMDETMKDLERAIDYKKQIDLKDKGYEHDFSFMDYATKFGIDFEGIKQRLLYEVELFTFLTDNEEVLDEKLNELKSRASKYDSDIKDGTYAKNFKAKLKKSLEHAQFAKKIFDKYEDKIFEKNQIDILNKPIVEKAITTKENIKITISDLTHSFSG